MKSFKDIFDEDYKMPIYERVYYFFLRTWDSLVYKIKGIKWFFQRGKKGYSDYDVWGFDSYLCKVIIGGLEQLKNNHCGCPSDLFDADKDDNECWKWVEVLDKIINGFKAAERIIDYDYDIAAGEYDGLKKEFDEGMELFKKYFFGLWD